MSKLDAILHPIRFRIVALLAGRRYTPQQIAARLPDIAQTTLYRHINTLVEEGILHVVSETQVRGTVERTYALVDGAARLTGEEAAALTKDDHQHYFILFLLSVLQDFNEYIEGDDTRPMLYSKTPLYLTDTEFQTLVEQMQTLLMPYIRQQPGTNRYLFTGITIPDEG
jgi:DNA-binding transcriptional ArsR family regulator